jgi:chromosome segregation ATPase
MLTDQERKERDPAAIQMELLEIEKQILDLTPVINQKNQEYQAAKAEFEVEKLRLKLLKERRSALQSVLKSVSIV